VTTDNKNERPAFRRFRLFLAALAIAASPGVAAPAIAQSEPEIHTGTVSKQTVHSQRYMIAAANPHAAIAGTDILRRGGSAVDAAIAAALVLGLVEPQSSGPGGGGFLLHWSAATKNIDSYDGRETAPSAAKPDHFLEADGRPVSRDAAHFGGRTVGVPGQIRLFAAAHANHGKLPWKDLFRPAIELAETGFAVSPRLHKQVRHRRRNLKDPTARAYFLDSNGDALPIGHRLVNEALAATLRIVADQGPDAFYTGAIARDIANAVSNATQYPSPMTEADIAAYRTEARRPVCTVYRAHRVCGMGPSSTGGLTVAMTLGMLAHFDMAALGPDSPEAVHLFMEASRLAFADRNKYIADPGFVRVPESGLLDPGYLARRAALIRRDGAMGKPKAGNPPMKKAMLLAPDETPEPPSTTHLSVVDADGNAVSLTTSIGRGFGSGIMVRGFLLNDHLISFAFRPELRGAMVANRCEPGKRPRSSMSPTIVTNPDGRLRLVVGSPGGIRIPGYVAQALVAVLDWKMDIQAALSQPHVAARDTHAELEKDTPATRFEDPLESLGHTVRIRTLTSGLHGIEILPDGTLAGGADPRREGMAMGE
jgi:gamma-glutamyltranspeptidase/glutathione hydrolase